ncbi:MAG: hypothetical protein QXG35_06355 [Nitrososphaerota archaeon]
MSSSWSRLSTLSRKIAGRIIGDGRAGEITLRLMEEFEKECRNPANGVKVYPR